MFCSISFLHFGEWFGDSVIFFILYKTLFIMNKTFNPIWIQSYFHVNQKIPPDTWYHEFSHEKDDIGIKIANMAKGWVLYMKKVFRKIKATQQTGASVHARNVITGIEGSSVSGTTNATSCTVPSATGGSFCISPVEAIVRIPHLLLDFFWATVSGLLVAGRGIYRRVSVFSSD